MRTIASPNDQEDESASERVQIPSGTRKFMEKHETKFGDVDAGGDSEKISLVLNFLVYWSRVVKKNHIYFPTKQSLFCINHLTK